MTLSINTPPFVKFDTAPMDRPSPSVLKSDNAGAPVANLKVTPLVVHQDNTQGGHGQVMVSAGSLSKLFDMLEQMFKTMREMFSGKNLTPPILPRSDQPKVKPDGGVLPKVMPDAADQPKIMPDTRPVVLPMPFRPAPQPTINVSNDSNAQVKVEVNVSHCHCPDTKADHDKDKQTRVIPNPTPNVVPKPDTTPKPDVTPQPDAKVVPDTQPKPDLTPKADTTPGTSVTPPDTKVVPDTVPQPEVKPHIPLPVPDLTRPGPSEYQTNLRHLGFLSRSRLKA